MRASAEERASASSDPASVSSPRTASSSAFAADSSPSRSASAERACSSSVWASEAAAPLSARRREKSRRASSRSAAAARDCSRARPASASSSRRALAGGGKVGLIRSPLLAQGQGRRLVRLQHPQPHRVAGARHLGGAHPKLEIPRVPARRSGRRQRVRERRPGVLVARDAPLELRHLRRQRIPLRGERLDSRLELRAPQLHSVQRPQRLGGHPRLRLLGRLGAPRPPLGQHGAVDDLAARPLPPPARQPPTPPHAHRAPPPAAPPTARRCSTRATARRRAPATQAPGTPLATRPRSRAGSSGRRAATRTATPPHPPRTRTAPAGPPAAPRPAPTGPGRARARPRHPREATRRPRA